MPNWCDCDEPLKDTSLVASRATLLQIMEGEGIPEGVEQQLGLCGACGKPIRDLIELVVEDGDGPVWFALDGHLVFSLGWRTHEQALEIASVLDIPPTRAKTSKYST